MPCQEEKNIVLNYKWLKVCLKNRQTEEEPLKQQKIAAGRKLSAELSTASVDSLRLASDYATVQRSRESCKGCYDRFS